MIVKEDQHSGSYIFQVPREILKTVPQQVAARIVEILSSQYVETFGEEIKKAIDKKKLTDSTLEKTSEKLSEEMSKFLKERLV